MRNGSIDASEVTVQVQSGKVTLDGTVSSRSMKHQLEDLVDRCLGVKDIDNRVRVERESSSGGTSSSASAESGRKSTTGSSLQGIGSSGIGSSSSGSTGGSSSASSGRSKDRETGA